MRSQKSMATRGWPSCRRHEQRPDAIGLRLPGATIGQQDAALCTEPVRREDRGRAHAAAETDRERSAPELCQLALAHPLRAVAREGSRDLVPEYDDKPCLICATARMPV